MAFVGLPTAAFGGAGACAGGRCLPQVDDNLEVRLVLLQRRLAERGGPLQIEKTGRGRFRFVVGRRLELV